jgi:phenylacetate-CoA ligase
LSAPNIPIYSRALDFEALLRDYPPAPDFLDIAASMSRDELRSLQNRRFLKQMERGWQVPFYKRHWSSVGLEPGDIRSLDDLEKVPPYTVADLKDSLGTAPWADYIGIDPETDDPMPLLLHTSGGTTGLPRPMIYSPVDREVMNIMSGRRTYMQGVRPFDLVQITAALGLPNGGYSLREGLWKYSGAVPVMAGSGLLTPTRRQIEIIQSWKVNFLAGFPPFLRHIALVARDEKKIDPRELRLKGLLTHLGTESRAGLEDLWGAPAYDAYATNECGGIAVECVHQSGLHIFEDAFVVEVNDADTGKAVPEGERGTLYVTALFKYAAPVIRYNVNDVSAFCTGVCRCGNRHRRLEKIYGRSDNMIKLRGINVFPEAVGALVSENKGCNGEYICVLERGGEAGRDDMTVMVELSPSAAGEIIQEELSIRFKEALGVKIAVKAVASGELAPLTGVAEKTKTLRVLDKRTKAEA